MGKALHKTVYSLLLLNLITFAFLLSEAYAGNTGGKREKVIDFEDDLVEGMNKQPLDSLNQISESEKKKRRPHLYRKRIGFSSETTQILKNIRYTP